MAKYEIDLLVNGSLDESAAKGTIKEFVSLIENQKNFKVDELGNKTLAYKIDKQTNAWYFIYTFECFDPSIIAEFRRLSDINANVLRRLIINLEKDYGYKASISPKKVAHGKILWAKYEKKQAEYRASKNESSSIVDDVLNASDSIESANEGSIVIRKPRAKKESE